MYSLFFTSGLEPVWGIPPRHRHSSYVAAKCLPGGEWIVRVSGRVLTSKVTVEFDLSQRRTQNSIQMDTEDGEKPTSEEIEDDEEDELQDWDDWEAEEDGEGDDGSDSDFLCLFCDSRYDSSDQLFDHCSSSHHFDFVRIRRSLGLDFYGCFKLINYVRSQVCTVWFRGKWANTSKFLVFQQINV